MKKPSPFKLCVLAITGIILLTILQITGVISLGTQLIGSCTLIGIQALLTFNK